jgi:hypothetical protein
LHSAEASLTEPAEAFVDLACDLVEPVAVMITRRLAEQADDPELWPLLKEAAMSAESALARFRLALDTEIRERSATHAPGVGDAQFERLLHHEHAVRGGAPELWRAVVRMEEETLASLRALAREMDGDWQGILAERLERAEREIDPCAESLRELSRIETFLAGQNLLPTETDGLAPVPMPGWIGTAGSPAVYLPPPLTGEGPGRLLLEDSAWARVFVSPLTAELGLPGLHRQVAMSRRLSAEIRRLSSPLLRGGWGLYVLDVLEEAGYWSQPEELLLVRAHQLFRQVLARVDIGVHTRQMSVEEGIAALLDRLPLDPGQAQAAVRGVLLAPTQAVGAVAGWRELLRLRAEREKAEHPFFQLRHFHDQVLSYGGLPVPLIRWGLES